MLAEKHGGKNVSKNSRKSLIGAKGLDDGGVVFHVYVIKIFCMRWIPFPVSFNLNGT